jgi:hypothetical protein
MTPTIPAAATPGRQGCRSDAGRCPADPWVLPVAGRSVIVMPGVRVAPPPGWADGDDEFVELVCVGSVTAPSSAEPADMSAAVTYP